MDSAAMDAFLQADMMAEQQHCLRHGRHEQSISSTRDHTTCPHMNSLFQERDRNEEEGQVAASKGRKGSGVPLLSTSQEELQQENAVTGGNDRSNGDEKISIEHDAHKGGAKDSRGVENGNLNGQSVLRSGPFFHYRDHSKDPDPDPLTPLTLPGRVPTFPVKLQAILNRPEFSEIVAWMPHGRAWRVLRPRQFEVQVIPQFFEHSKYSSFIRQANGWGFRRITTGLDRGCYYHPRFLRGLPQLCKAMRRPGVAEKQFVDPDHEPDLYLISKLHPLSDKPDQVDEEQLRYTLEGGPRARMPMHIGAIASAAKKAADAQVAAKHAAAAGRTRIEAMNAMTTASAVPPQSSPSSSATTRTTAATNDPMLTPQDMRAAQVFEASLNACDTMLQPHAIPGIKEGSTNPSPPPPLGAPAQATCQTTPPLIVPGSTPGDISATMYRLMMANQLAFVGLQPLSHDSQLAAAMQASAAASQFAAGFAAAAALSHQQMQHVLQNWKAASSSASTSPTSSTISQTKADNEVTTNKIASSDATGKTTQAPSVTIAANAT